MIYVVDLRSIEYSKIGEKTVNCVRNPYYIDFTDKDVLFLLSGLVIENYPQIPVRKWVTYAGLLNHSSWTQYKKLPPLTQSLDLATLPNVPQVHFVGEKDKVIPLELSRQWTVGKKLVIVPGVAHNGPFE